MTALWIFGLFIFSGAIVTSATNRMMNGDITTIEKYPYIASVEFLNYEHNWQHTCSASILNSRFVLSAARCFIDWQRNLGFARIRAGTSTIYYGGQIIYVEYVTNHPDYSRTTNRNDISVVKIARALPSLPSIQQAVLVTHGSTIPDYLEVDVVGWGRPITLRRLIVSTFNNKSCAELYKGIGFEVTNDMVCLRIPDFLRDSCNYDIGGPVVYQGILIGVVSECTLRLDSNNSLLPLVSTSVASYTRWVSETAR